MAASYAAVLPVLVLHWLKKKDLEVEHEPTVSIFMRKLNSIKLGGFLPLSSLD